MSQFPVFTSEQVTCDATGFGKSNGLGPNVYGHTWEIHSVVVQNDSATNQSECQLYLNFPVPSWQIGGTWSGNMDSNNDTYTLKFGDKLIAVWTGADPNSHSLVLVSGVGYDPRNHNAIR